MLSLVDLLAKSARGRIFLFNLYEGLASSPPHIDKVEFKAKIWDVIRSTLSTKTPGGALKFTFATLHEKQNRSLRYKRSPRPKVVGRFSIHTTTRPHDVIYDPQKQVLDRTLTDIRISRRDMVAPWTPRQARLLCKSLEETKFQNGKPFAHGYDIFWATMERDTWRKDADTLRDAQGLVHIDKDEPIIQLRFECTMPSAATKIGPTSISGPTVVEATSHRRFKVRCASMRPVSGAGSAADLEELRVSDRLRDGVDEITLSSTPMSTLGEARFVGYTTQHADISDLPPSWRTVWKDDARYADLIEPHVGSAAAFQFVKAELE